MTWWKRLFGAPPVPAAYLKAWDLVGDDAATGTRIEVGAVDAYIEAIKGALADHFASLPPSAGRDLCLVCTIKPGGTVSLSTLMSVADTLDPEVLGPLYTRLDALPVPPIREGSVVIRSIHALWGGSPARPFGV